MPNFHTRLKKARLEQRLSQIQLAEKARVTQPTIANWESGSHIPRQAALARLSDVLKVETGWLLLGSRNETSGNHVDYLSLPTRHITIYAWNDDWETLKNSKPLGYMPYASESASLIAISMPLIGSHGRVFHIVDTHAPFAKKSEGLCFAMTKNGLDILPANIAENIAAHICATLSIYS
ncbi:MAG: helix-turn-helix domain-containing protein [Maricaulaceae bacterium]